MCVNCQRTEVEVKLTLSLQQIEDLTEFLRDSEVHTKEQLVAVTRLRDHLLESGMDAHRRSIKLRRDQDVIVVRAAL